MSEMDRLREIIDRAHDEVVRLCSPGEQWRMSIPANPERDSDLLISDALRGARDALDALSVLAAKVEALHQRQPADSPFNHEGRDVCGTCMDGAHPADWPCPTVYALADAQTPATDLAEATREAVASGWLDPVDPDRPGASVGRNGDSEPASVPLAAEDGSGAAVDAPGAAGLSEAQETCGLEFGGGADA